MVYSFIKIMSSALIIFLISEISKRSTFFGSIIASLPLLSIMAFIWMYVDTKDVKKIAELSTNIFWLVIPSLVLFVVFPVLLKKSVPFFLSLGISSTIMVIVYFLMIPILKKFGVTM